MSVNGPNEDIRADTDFDLFPLAGKTARSRLPVLSLFLVITGFQIGVAEREYLKSGYFVHIHVHD
ncbi:MAG: hypothetical protein CL912_21030 [Deltaproteobacteria bacterium]|mgnify:CR=1|nr:hypothetical protein [Deltaproteobacteria bacterium]